MSQLSFIFPTDSNNSIQTYSYIFRNFKIIPADKRDVLFDCANISFIKPLGLNLLSAMIFSFISNGNKVLIKLPNNEAVVKYLRDQGFFSEFNIEAAGEISIGTTRGTSASLKRLQDVMDASYLDSIAYWICRNSDIPLTYAEALIRINLVELINNVFDHSESPIGCYISAQAYPRMDWLILSILDFGIGIKRSLQPHYPELSSDVDAIRKALEEGVSSKKHERRPRGVGLTVIKDFLAVDQRGNLEIISYTGLYHSGGGTKTLDVPLRGTCVNLYINARASFESDEADIWS